MRVVICGGGVIGACTAWFLASRGCEVVVVERHLVAGAASGKSGGFLALDWCDGSPLRPLARRSFALHAELAAAFPDRWGYRRLPTAAVTLTRQAGRAVGGLPGWLAPEARFGGWLGTPETTAQVDPEAFTTGIMDLARERGAGLIRGVVQGRAERRRQAGHRRRGRWRGAGGRRGGHRHGAVVGPCGRLAGAAGDLRARGAQPRLR
ncbi:MAG: FAD-dependent oxidoreductase [Geminicoccaceae bacterium]